MKSEISVDQAATCEREARASPRTALTVTTHHSINLINGIAPWPDGSRTGERRQNRARFASRPARRLGLRLVVAVKRQREGRAGFKTGVGGGGAVLVALEWPGQALASGPGAWARVLRLGGGRRLHVLRPQRGAAH
jgi:hypothetical protein